MSFLETPSVEASSDETRRMYDQAVQNDGYLPNMVRLFGHRPDVMAAWRTLAGTVRSHMDLRRYELVTLAAARALRSSYCMLAHGSVLLQDGMDPVDLHAIVTEEPTAPLNDQERAIMTFAGQIVRDATGVTAADIDELRDAGLSDPEIFDIAAAAAMRCFFSKTLDALGAQPDSVYLAFDLGLRDALEIGRPIERP